MIEIETTAAKLAARLREAATALLPELMGVNGPPWKNPATTYERA